MLLNDENREILKLQEGSRPGFSDFQISNELTLEEFDSFGYVNRVGMLEDYKVS